MTIGNRVYGVKELAHDVEVTLSGRRIGENPPFYRITALAQIQRFRDNLDKASKNQHEEALRDLVQHVRQRTK